MRFEWNKAKASTNLDKHGVKFELAVTAFDDPFALVTDDSKHSTKTERREWLMGESDEGVLVVVFTIRNNGKIRRIISARKAKRRERRRYEESKNIPL